MVTASSLPMKVVALSWSIVRALSVRVWASANEPAARAVASTIAAVTAGSANERRSPVSTDGGSRPPASRPRRNSHCSGRVSTASGAMIARSGNAWAPRSALATCAPICWMPPIRSSRPNATTAAAAGTSSHGTKRSEVRRIVDRPSTRPPTRTAATTTTSPTAASTPSTVCWRALRTAARSSSGAGPKVRTASRASAPPAIAPMITEPTVPAATRTPSAPGDWPFNNRRRSSRSRSRVTRAVAATSSAAAASRPASRTGAMVPATTALAVPAWRTTARSASPPASLFTDRSWTSTRRRAVTTNSSKRSASTAASWRLRPAGSGRISHWLAW